MDMSTVCNNHVTNDTVCALFLSQLFSNIFQTLSQLCVVLSSKFVGFLQERKEKYYKYSRVTHMALFLAFMQI